MANDKHLQTAEELHKHLLFFFIIQPITIIHLITARLHFHHTLWWTLPYKAKLRFFFTIMTRKDVIHSLKACNKKSLYKHCMKQLRNINLTTNRQSRAMSFRGGKLFFDEWKIIHFSANCKTIQNLSKSFSASMCNNALKLPLWLNNDFRTVSNNIEGRKETLTFCYLLTCLSLFREAA